jgi:2-polyprenyl-6-methoxyphenol hydroxylase-like FAD-dependent oxidoreductase
VSERYLDVDVAIVGGGVAGATLAIALARAGVDVAVVEREEKFRDRVRGDGLFPWGTVEASRLGIADVLPAAGGRPLPIWQTYADRAPNPPYDWRDDVPTGDVLWGIDHPRLQEALLQEAERSGARVLRPAKALSPRRMQGGGFAMPIAGEGEAPVVRATLIVGADGKDSAVRRWMGATTLRDPIHHLLGGCLVESVDLDPDAAHVASFDGGLAILYRHGSGRARAYLVCQPAMGEGIRGRGARRRFLEAFAAPFPEGAMRNARAVGPAAFFPASDVYPDRVAGEGIVLIGDAAGANDPSQGQGLALAFRDVRELSYLLTTEGDWQRAIEAFARWRSSWYDPLRAFAIWKGPLVTDVGPEAEAARDRQRRAAELDPELLGYTAIYARGPEGLPITEEARRHYLGEDLELPAQGEPRPSHQ